MACACKVNQQLTFLQKKYGNEMPKSKSTNISVRMKIFFRGLVNGVVITLLSPFMIFGILFHMIFKRHEPININKVFRIAK